MIKLLKLSIYTVILALSALPSTVRGWRAYELYQAPSRVSAWEPHPGLLWALVPLAFWLLIMVSTLIARHMDKRFYMTVLGVSMMGGVTIGKEMGPEPKLSRAHPDKGLIAAMRQVQTELESGFVAVGAYRLPALPDAPLPGFTPSATLTLRPFEPAEGVDCSAVGELWLWLSETQYALIGCGLDGAIAGAPTALTQADAPLVLSPDKNLRRGIYLESIKQR